QYLNKSTSIRTAKESIEFNANNLLNEQKVEEMNKESIEMFVKLKNSENDLNLSVTAYLSQLEYKDVEEVKNTIDEEVIKELEHNEKRLKEIELKAEKEKERIKQESIEAEPLKSIVNDLPFENIEQDEETATETESNETIEFRVYVPVNKLNSLIDFLR